MSQSTASRSTASESTAPQSTASDSAASESTAANTGFKPLARDRDYTGEVRSHFNPNYLVKIVDKVPSRKTLKMVDKVFVTGMVYRQLDEKFTVGQEVVVTVNTADYQSARWMRPMTEAEKPEYRAQKAARKAQEPKEQDEKAKRRRGSSEIQDVIDGKESDDEDSP